MKSKNTLKPSLAISLVLILLVTPSRNTLQSASTYKSLQPITMAEDYYENTWDQSIISDYFDVLQPDNKDKYLYLGLPTWDKMKNASFLKQNPERAIFYKIKKIPTFIINGNYDKSQDYSDTKGLQLITEGIKKAKQYATMEIKQSQDDNYLLKITGTDKRLKGKKLNVNVLVLKNEVNCDNNKDQFRTRILKRVVSQYIYDKAMGTSIKLEEGQEVLQSIKLKVPKVDQNRCQILGFIQDMNNGEILAAGYTDMIDGKPALFNIDNLPDCTVDLKEIVKYTKLGDIEREMLNLPQYREKMGLAKKVISVTDAKDLKHLSLQLDYTDTEAKIYQVLAAALNTELKDNATFTYDPIKNQINIKFTNPINGNKELFYFYIRINKATINGFKDENDNLGKSVHFKFSEFYAYDSKKNLIKYEVREQKPVFPVRMCTIPHPSDFNGDAKINETDLLLLSKKYGTRLGDKDYHKRYDICDIGPSKDRIDIFDLIQQKREIIKQERLQKEIDNAIKLQESFRGET